IDAALGMPICDGGQCSLEIGKRFGTVDFAGFNQRSDAPPSNAAFIVTCKECVLAIESDGADEIFNPVGVNLHAAICQKGLQAVPMVMDISKLFSQARFCG